MTSLVLALGIGSFVGNYSLESENILAKNQQAICSESIEITAQGNALNVSTMTFNATAEVNGPAVKLVDSVKAGDFKITFANDQLALNLNGTLPKFISPNDDEYSETITLTPSQSADKLNVHHTMSSQLPEVNADSECVYVKN